MKVLIVDDDVVSRMAIADILANFEDVEVSEAIDGAHAWQLLDGGLNPVLCCCDIKMPGLSGIALMQRCRATPALEKLPFVMFSSVSDRDFVMEAVRSGAAGYMLKPFKVDEARTYLERTLKQISATLAENPKATLKRLQISPDRLIAYLHSLREQLKQSVAPLSALLEKGDEITARTEVRRLAKGCITLGLWHASAALEQLNVRASDIEAVGLAIESATKAVTAHLERARNEIGSPAESGTSGKTLHASA
jgi:two-component system chemotaxis response regulator CheY